jgi:hypothetical protein
MKLRLCPPSTSKQEDDCPVVQQLGRDVAPIVGCPQAAVTFLLDGQENAQLGADPPLFACGTNLRLICCSSSFPRCPLYFRVNNSMVLNKNNKKETARQGPSLAENKTRGGIFFSSKMLRTIELSSSLHPLTGGFVRRSTYCSSQDTCPQSQVSTPVSLSTLSRTDHCRCVLLDTYQVCREITARLIGRCRCATCDTKIA